MHGKITKDPRVQSYVSEQGIKWKFIIELQPWMGGFYERLVGSSKRALKKTIGKKYLTSFQLQTFLSETETVLNSRPLMYVGDYLNEEISHQSKVMTKQMIQIMNQTNHRQKRHCQVFEKRDQGFWNHFGRSEK